VKFLNSILRILIFTLCLGWTTFAAYSYEYAILVDKEEHVLNVYHWDDDDKRELIVSYAVVTGKEKGNKIQRGDNKTPEGIYFATKIKTVRSLRKQYGAFSKKYGVLAFVLNYPNIYDEEQNKTGSGIWIHGVESDDRILSPFDTEGCVALANKDIKDLRQYIHLRQTPIVIVDTIQGLDIDGIFTVGSDKHVLWMEKWRNSWESQDIFEYGKLYSDHFKFKRKGKKTWINYKKKIAKKTGKNISIQLNNPKIVEFKDQLVLTFEQKYFSPLNKDEGKKSLYLQRENGSFSILAEEFYPLFNWK